MSLQDKLLAGAAALSVSSAVFMVGWMMGQRNEIQDLDEVAASGKAALAACLGALDDDTREMEKATRKLNGCADSLGGCAESLQDCYEGRGPKPKLEMP